MRSLAYVLFVSGQVVLLAGCPKSESAATSSDSAATSAAASVSQVVLAPLDTTAPSASATATTTAIATATATTTAIASSTVVLPHGDAAVKPVTSATPSAQAQFKQCCAALHKQSQQQTPQAAQLAQAAGICDGLAATMATAPAMPQMDQVKALLAGVQLPPVCLGL